MKQEFEKIQLGSKQTREQLKKILNVICDNDLTGTVDTVHSSWVKWVWNRVDGGTHSNPYLGRLRLPGSPVKNLNRLSPETINLVAFNRSDTYKSIMLMESVRKVKNANKYLAYQEKRLDKAIKENNPRLYWRISWNLIKNSESNLLYFLNKTYKGWYYNSKLENVHINKNLVRIKTRGMGGIEKAEESRSNPHHRTMHHKELISINRFYVKKKNGKLRPIGAPQSSDRIYLSMLAFYTSKWAERYLRKDQHGFRTGHGIWSAWVKFLTDTRHRNNLLEYDLTKFFNRVPITKHLTNIYVNENSLQKALKEIDIPEWMIRRIIRLNFSLPIGFPEDMDTGRTQIDVTDPEMWPYLIQPSDKSGEFEEIYAGGSHFGEKLFSPYLFGLTQGSPLSPVLANIYLRSINLNEKLQADGGVHYADDGIVYYNQEPAEEVENLLTQAEKEINQVTQSEESLLKMSKIHLDEEKYAEAEDKGSAEVYIAPENETMNDEDGGLLPHITCLWTRWEKARNKIKEQLENNWEEVEKTLPNFNSETSHVFSENHGAIEFNRNKSRWIKRNGKWLVNKVKFLGSVFNPEKETLNGTPLSKINFKNIWKIVGRTYNIDYPETWEWKIKKTSLLNRLMMFGLIPKIEVKVPIRLKQKGNLDTGVEIPEDVKWIVRSASTVCCGTILKQWSLEREANRNRKRKKEKDN